MVISCVAFGCSNEQVPTRPISFHSFPFKRPEILDLWVKATNRVNWYPSKGSKLCSDHFLPSDYQYRPGAKTKLLKLDAVPSVFSYSDNTCKQICSCRKEKVNKSMDIDLPNKCDIDPPSRPTTSRPRVFVDQTPRTSPNKQAKLDVDVPSLPSTPKSRVLFVDQATQTSTKKLCTDMEIFLLKLKLKKLVHKLRRRDLKISIMKEALKEISRSGLCTENLDDILENDFGS